MTASVDDLLKVFETIFDGDVEHSEPFALEVLDNPGWSISFGRGWMPGLEPFLRLGQQRDGDIWYALEISDNLINGYCGAGCLHLLTGEFLDAIEKWRQAGGAPPDPG
jgi:hypothetical protein